MGDYSLEAFQSRPARQGEVYETVRFPSGSVGFVAADTSKTDDCGKVDKAPEPSTVPSVWGLLVLRFRRGAQELMRPPRALTVVCIACDMRLRLQGIKDWIRKSCHVRKTEEVSFVRIESGLCHDGVRFANGVEITLQQLGPGVTAVVIDDLLGSRKRPEPKTAKEPLSFRIA